MSAWRQSDSAYERASDFIRSEFFSLDHATFAKIMRLYEGEYGTGAYNYLMRTFHKWRLGYVGMSGQTQYRILHCVPRFLSPAKQFTILAFYIPEYMKQLIEASHVHNMTMDAVPSAFANAAKRCQETEPKLDWFVHGIFTEEEIAAFAEVARYTALDRLHRSYAAVRVDLATTTSHLSEADASVSMCYRLDEVGCVIELNGVVPALPPTAFDLPPMPALVVRNREEYERLLRDHQCEMIAEQEGRVARHAVAQLDLSILQNAIASLSKADSVESTFQVHGAGGTFEGTVSRKNLPGLKAQLLGRITVATLGTVGLVAGIAAIFASERFGGLVVCGIWLVLGVIPAMWSWVIKKHKEVSDYERGRSTRIAKIQR